MELILTLTKPENSSYSLLMIEPEDGTQINVELTKEEDDDDDDGNGWVIVLIIILAIIVFFVLLILIFRYIRRKNQDIDFIKKTEDIQQETLLKEYFLIFELFLIISFFSFNSFSISFVLFSICLTSFFNSLLT